VPGDAKYNSARRVWNWRYDEHPAMIAQCANSDDVRRSVEFARKQNLLAAIRAEAIASRLFDLRRRIGDRSIADEASKDRSGKAHSPRGARTLIADFDNAAAPRVWRRRWAHVRRWRRRAHLGGETMAGRASMGPPATNLTSVDLVTADGELARAKRKRASGPLLGDARGGRKLRGREPRSNTSSIP